MQEMSSKGVQEKTKRKTEKNPLEIIRRSIIKQNGHGNGKKYIGGALEWPNYPRQKRPGIVDAKKIRTILYLKVRDKEQQNRYRIIKTSREINSNIRSEESWDNTGCDR